MTTETWLVLGAVELLVVILFFVMLSRIETATRRTAELLGNVLGELQGLNHKAFEARRDGIRVDVASLPPAPQQGGAEG